MDHLISYYSVFEANHGDWCFFVFFLAGHGNRDMYAYCPRNALLKTSLCNAIRFGLFSLARLVGNEGLYLAALKVTHSLFKPESKDA